MHSHKHHTTITHRHKNTHAQYLHQFCSLLVKGVLGVGLQEEEEKTVDHCAYIQNLLHKHTHTRTYACTHTHTRMHAHRHHTDRPHDRRHGRDKITKRNQSLTQTRQYHVDTDTHSHTRMIHSDVCRCKIYTCMNIYINKWAFIHTFTRTRTHTCICMNECKNIQRERDGETESMCMCGKETRW